MEAHGFLLALFVSVVRRERLEVAAAAETAGRATVGCDRGGHVPDLPPCETQPPTEIGVVLLHEERRVEVLTVDRDALERSSSNEHSGVDPEDLLGAIVLAEIRFAFAAGHDAAATTDANACGIQHIHLLLCIPVVPQHLAAGQAGTRMSREESEHLGYVGRAEEDVRVEQQY